VCQKVGTPVALVPDMKTTLNRVLLQNIGQQISNGRPLWAMARVNEYLSVSDPLRKVFVLKASKLVNVGMPVEIAHRIINEGTRFGELTEAQQAQLLNIEPAINTTPTRVTFTNKLIKARTARVASNYKKTLLRPRFASV